MCKQRLAAASWHITDHEKTRLQRNSLSQSSFNYLLVEPSLPIRKNEGIAEHLEEVLTAHSIAISLLSTISVISVGLKQFNNENPHHRVRTSLLREKGQQWQPIRTGTDPILPILLQNLFNQLHQYERHHSLRGSPPRCSRARPRAYLNGVDSDS